MTDSNEIVRVRDVMKNEVDLVDGLLTVEEALSAMKYPQTRTFLIDKRNDDDEYGAVTFGDIAREVLAPSRPADRISLYEIMSKPVITVQPDMDIRYCTRLFARFGLSRAPVLENGRFVGLISYSDIVLKGLQKQGGPADS